MRLQPDELIKPAYDFSVAERGKFYRAEAKFQFPIYLESDVDDFLSTLAEKRNVNIQELVNRLFKADQDIIQNA